MQRPLNKQGRGRDFSLGGNIFLATHWSREIFFRGMWSQYFFSFFFFFFLFFFFFFTNSTTVTIQATLYFTLLTRNTFLAVTAVWLSTEAVALPSDDLSWLGANGRLSDRQRA